MEPGPDLAGEPTNRALWERLTCLAVAVGVALRVWEYSSFRALYMDEEALLKNLVGVPIFDFGHVLSQDQLAPPGFLVVERLMLRSPLDELAAGRLFPLLCGLASMLLVVPLARRFVDRRAVPIAAWFLALADHLIYYSAEIKQYSCDLVLAMAALLVAIPRDAERPTPRRIAALALLGVVAPWFSYPVVFVLAGVGFHWIARRAMVKDGRGVALAVGVCLAWLISFVGCFAVSHIIVSKRDFLWVWWNFAFLPIPPHSANDARFVAETLANVFINPGSLLTPFSLAVTAVLASGLAVVGCVSLGRRWRGGLFLLLAPLVFSLAASALRQYPFHGRLILSLVPTYHLLLAEGIAAVGRLTHVGATIFLALVFIVGQASDIGWNQFVMPKSRARPFDTHGDLKNDLLDYLDDQRRPPRRPERERTP
ncbi:glycosyltransferase family 39 protein [Paludisphaera borealis]|uniref:Glycosyltransferase RgtA/B/C/D-like domain-containing protein n=1 Tax=Paludisphaera borealis TaxID=1387353 RepID=A0A1U7CK65_9BACT|nr:glycosyltransferase family 39 protein [Paludisphaera borealis]APW59321.1 putative glycosyltransferase of unknown function [Paludisphaera borealis]